MYCGHGSGENLYRTASKDLQDFPISFLFGCSSIRLRDRGFHESTGSLPLLTQMNCPCILGNLWDVTDRDLDRFTIETLKSYFADESCRVQSMPNIVKKAKSICKLVHAVGSAPVVYGIPI